MMLLDLDQSFSSSGMINREFRSDVLQGLGRIPRVIPARWLYDERGSELFEKITQVAEYYPTRTERGILNAHADEIADRVGFVGSIMEFGSGSSDKTSALISAVEPEIYVPIDISGDFLQKSVKKLEMMYPNLSIYPIEGDFSSAMLLPLSLVPGPRLGFFAGSTIGNLSIPAAVDLLRIFVQTLGEDGMLLIGIDQVQDADLLVPAYDDRQGVTAEFNLNLLRRINRELRGNIPIEAFRHRARWNAAETRMEMHLEAERDVRFEVDGFIFSLAEGETIHTENSHKYGSQNARLLLRAGGWRPIAEWTDERARFALHLASVAPFTTAP